MPNYCKALLKSDNLQNNTLGRWVNGTNDLMFQVLFFFIISWEILFKNCFNLFFIFSYKSTKIRIKSFECPKSLRDYKKIILEHQTLGRRVICSREPGYYIVECWIFFEMLEWSFIYQASPITA